jgi:hypothetical protein
MSLRRLKLSIYEVVTPREEEVVRPEGKRPCKRPRCGWEDSTERGWEGESDVYSSGLGLGRVSDSYEHGSVYESSGSLMFRKLLASRESNRYSIRISWILPSSEL